MTNSQEPRGSVADLCSLRRKSGTDPLSSRFSDGHEAETVAALLTAPGRGAVATIWLHGPNAIEVVDQFFRARSGRPLCNAPLHRIVYGHWQHEQGSEDVVVVRTDDSSVEIHSHGGTIAPQLVLAAICKVGVTQVTSQRALQLQHTNPWQAAAIAAASQALTLRAADRLLANADGRLVCAVTEVCAMIGDQSQLATARKRLTELADSYAFGSRLVSGWQIAIAGRPNVGKSSLINRLLGYERSIVFDQPGTTRDVLFETTAIAGWPIRICDTAGLRLAEGEIERIGVARAKEAIDSADLTIWVSDLSQPWTEIDQQSLDTIPNVLHVCNKSDLSAAPDARPQGLRVSLLCDPNVDAVLAAIEERLFLNLPPAAPILVQPWQLQTVLAALDRLASSDPSGAQHLLRTPLLV